jgi:nicotinate-nucleotide adenylyltransferase
MGADQLLHLDSWHEWRELFTLAHLAVASRPGFGFDDDFAALPPEVAREAAARRASAAALATTPYGHLLVDETLALDVSATEIRRDLPACVASGQRRGTAADKLPAAVWDYILQHHLYLQHG